MKNLCYNMTSAIKNTQTVVLCTITQLEGG